MVCLFERLSMPAFVPSWPCLRCVCRRARECRAAACVVGMGTNACAGCDDDDDDDVGAAGDRDRDDADDGGDDDHVARDDDDAAGAGDEEGDQHSHLAQLRTSGQ